MAVRQCLDELVGLHESYNNQAQALYHFIALLIVLILLFKILQARFAVGYLDLIVG